jgi:hypothetical protein
MLAAAAANCLSARLMYCVSKTDVKPRSLNTRATCKIVRNEKGRLRVVGLDVRIAVGGDIEQEAKLNGITLCTHCNELVTVVEGALELSIAGQTWVVQPGDEVFIPEGAVHSVKNIHTDTTRWLYGYD